MTAENWSIRNGQQAPNRRRQRKAYNIRLCRHYLRRALDMGLMKVLELSLRSLACEKVPVHVGARHNAEPVWQIAEQLQKEA